MLRSMREARDRRTSNYVCIGSQADMAGPDIFEIEHNAPNVRSYVLRVETEFGAHLQHGRVFGQHIAIHAPQTLFFRAIDDMPHQQPAEPVTLEPRAYQDRELRGLFAEFVNQAHEPEHVTRAFVERDESHFVRGVGQLIDLRGADRGNTPKKPKSQILGADIA